MKDRLIIGISGASGAPLAVELMRQLAEYKSDIESHLIYTNGAIKTIKQETSLELTEIEALADKVYDNSDIGAGPASGSFKTIGMIIIPCSMKTAAGIVTGYSENLLLRAADVTLKERRKLIVVPRECPLSTIHLRNLYELSKLGVTIIPPVMSYYNKLPTVDEHTAHIVGKVMDQFGLESTGLKRWVGM